MSTCVGSVGAGDDGVNVVNLLRSLKGKVCGCIPLVQSLVATQGEHFHHIFLQQALQNARASGVVVTSAIDDLLSVRHITALAEAMDWKQLVLTLEETYVKSSNVHELRHQGMSMHLNIPCAHRLAIKETAVSRQRKRMPSASKGS